MKQASLRNSAPPLIERRPEPLGKLNKGHTVRTSRGLPFDASYACTSMHEFRSPLFLPVESQTIHTPQWSQSPTQPGVGPSWAYSPYLPLEKREQVGVWNETQARRSVVYPNLTSNHCAIF